MIYEYFDMPTTPADTCPSCGDEDCELTSLIEAICKCIEIGCRCPCHEGEDPYRN
jgi:hypothetical protein